MYPTDSQEAGHGQQEPLEPDGQFRVGGSYAQHFGLVYVDFRSQKRTIKDSGDWYAQLAASGKLA